MRIEGVKFLVFRDRWVSSYEQWDQVLDVSQNNCFISARLTAKCLSVQCLNLFNNKTVFEWRCPKMEELKNSGKKFAQKLLKRVEKVMKI
jgi:hypothetical protein